MLIAPLLCASSQVYQLAVKTFSQMICVVLVSAQVSSNLIL